MTRDEYITLNTSLAPLSLSKYDTIQAKLIKSYEIQSLEQVSTAALNPNQTRFVVGGNGFNDLWVRVYDFSNGMELDVVSTI